MLQLVLQHLRLILTIMVSTMLLNVSALAQTPAEDTPQSPPAATQVEEQAQTSAAIDVEVRTEAPEIDLSDPALLELLHEREKADRAVIEAIIAQQEKASQETHESDDEPKKKSLIPTSADDVKALGKKILDKIISWLTSPSFLAQIGAIVAAYLISPILAGAIRKRVFLFRDEAKKDVKLRIVRDYIYQARHFLRAIILVGLLALSAVILKAVPIAGQDWLVKLAQGLAVVFLIYKVIKTFISNPLVEKLAIWTAIPLAVLMVFGYFDDLQNFLNASTVIPMGDNPITAMTLVRLAIFGALFFYLGNLSNTKGQTAIRSQETLDAGVREITAKLFQIILFIIIFILVMSFAGINLSALVVVFSAIGLGIGFGLQPIAANFISGLIILFDRSVQIGDYVVLGDGQEGHVEAINMRSTTVETTDGKDIMVPNTTFTENAYENWTHKDPRQRYEVHFAVAYDTDIDSLEDILIPAISEHPSVLQEPELPDLELREFGDHGIKFAIEFWCSGIDDGPNKFTSDLNFIVWRTLKANNIEIPFPQRVVRNIK